MKKTLPFLMVSIMMTIPAFGQSARDRIMKDISLAGFVYTPYPTAFPKLSAVPDGYEPFYISHYGRHGSRYILDEKNFTMVYETLLKADSVGGATRFGEEIAARMRTAAMKCKGRGGDLTPVGIAQHRGIAARMFESYPEIFKHNPRVAAISTTSPRALLSMNAFTNELLKMSSGMDIDIDTGEIYMPALNPYHMEKAYEARIDAYRYPAGPWSRDLDEFEARTIDNTRVLSSLFTKEYLSRGAVPEDFVRELFRNCVCLEGTDVGISLMDVFTADELYRWWRRFNIQFYYEKGPSGTGGGFLNEVCVTMLEGFLDDAGKRIAENSATGRPSVTLRFGHDGCIINMLNVMGVEGWSREVRSMDDVEKVFFVSDIPMAATLQWTFYRNVRTGDVIVRMTLNERELDFPIGSDCKPFVHWNDVREKYDKVINQIKSNPK